MSKKDVWVVFGHFLDLNYYYVSNTEWTFEIEEACLFKTKELAESTIGRLKTYSKFGVNEVHKVLVHQE
jgi:hypothetical protein